MSFVLVSAGKEATGHNVDRWKRKEVTKTIAGCAVELVAQPNMSGLSHSKKIWIILNMLLFNFRIEEKIRFQTLEYTGKP